MPRITLYRLREAYKPIYTHIYIRLLAHTSISRPTLSLGTHTARSLSLCDGGESLGHFLRSIGAYNGKSAL